MREQDQLSRRIVLGTSFLEVLRCLKICAKLPDNVRGSDRAGYERVHVPFDRKIGLSAIFHALGVRYVSPSTDD